MLENEHAPDDALATVRVLEAEQDVEVRDAAVVIRTEVGRIELQQTRQIAPGEGIVGGGTVGLVAGLLLGLPVGGALIGLAGGALLGCATPVSPTSACASSGKTCSRGSPCCACWWTRRRRACARGAPHYGTAFEVELSSDIAP